jgi:hypothetical protein
MRNVVVVGTVLLLLASAPAAPAAINPPQNPDQYVGNCGDATHGAGCNDPACQACVCNESPDCCTDDWDSQCLGIAGDSCPAECFAVVGNCGVPRPEPGCSDPLCEACVCAQFDALGASCCETEWSDSCAQIADGILANNDNCLPVCLLANRTHPAPAISAYGLFAAVLAASGIAWWRLRRRPAAR